VARGVVADALSVEFGWNRFVDLTQELEELPMALTGLTLREHRSAESVERSKQRCGPVERATVRDPSTSRSPIGNIGCSRLSAQHCLFSSTPSTDAFSGG